MEALAMTDDMQNELVSVLQSDDEAEACVERIAYWEAQKDKWEKYYEAQKVAFMEKADKKIAYQKMLLEQYFNQIPHHSTKTRETYQLPSGSLVRSKATDKVVKTDESAIMMWLAENEITGYVEVETKEKLKWGELKKRLSIVDGHAVDTKTGEFVSGVSVEHVDSEFVVRMTKGENENED